MYSIDPNRQKRRVTLSFDGLMRQDPQVFFKELTDAVKSVRGSEGEWDLLVDFSGTPVMPQDRAKNTAKIFDWCLENDIRKVAAVMETITQRMQLQRVTGRNDKIAYFESRSDAQSWLDD